MDLNHPDLERLHHHGDREATPGLVDLAVNVRGPAPDWLLDVVRAADLTVYPDDSVALQAVSARHGRPVDEVLLTAGAAEAFVLVARGLPFAHAAVVHPQFTEPEAALLAAGRRVSRVVLPWPYVLDPAAIPEDADLVVIGNPTNPTSVLHPRAMLASLARPGRVLVVDEAFADCVVGEPESLAAADLPGLLVVRSLTKTWGLAGLRCGYVLGAAQLLADLRAAQPLWPVSTPALAAIAACSAPAAVDEASAWAAGLADDRKALVAALEPMVEVAPDAAASFVLVRHRSPGLRERLRALGFAPRRGDTFPGLDDDFLRIAVRDSATTRAFAAALATAL